MLNRWLDRRRLARINERLAPVVAANVVDVQSRSVTAWVGALVAGTLGLIAGAALDHPSGVGADMWPMGAIALALLGALLAFVGLSLNYLFIETDRNVVLFATASSFRADLKEVVAQEAPPLDYEMRRRILFRKIYWQDRSLWVPHRDAGEFEAIAGGRSDPSGNLH